MELEEMLAKAVEKALATQVAAQPQAPAAAVEMVSKAEVEALVTKALTEQAATFEAKFAELAQKAMSFDRTGVGRQGGAQTEEVTQANAIDYLVKKAQDAKSHDELTHAERRAIGIVTVDALLQGMVS